MEVIQQQKLLVMGKAMSTCQTMPSQESFLQEQLALFHWRADPLNEAISKVFFRKELPSTHHVFHQMLAQNHNNYLEVNALMQSLSDHDEKISGEIIVFEEYPFTLEDITSLNINEALYILKTLLIGFQNLQSQFEFVIISPKCCFINTKGEVSVWINPSPKSHSIWPGNQLCTPKRAGNATIIPSILHLIQNITQSHLFDVFLYELEAHRIKNQTSEMNYYNVRKFINEYAYFHKININHHLQSKVTHKNTFPQIVNQKQVFLKAPSTDKLKTSQIFSSKKLLQSKSQELFKQVNFISLDSEKSESLESESVKNCKQFEVQNQILPTFSQIINSQGRQCNQFGKVATKMTSLKNSQFLMRDEVKDQENSDTQKNVQTQRNKRQSYQTVESNEYQQNYFQDYVHERQSAHGSNTDYQQKKNTKSQIVNMNLKGQRPNFRKKSNISIVNYMQPSNIMSSEMKCSQINQLKALEAMEARQRRENKYKTSLVPSLNNDRKEDCADQAEKLYWTRPWITTKTITKLISENSLLSEKKSLRDSLSSECNGSVYSGALSKYGRNVSPVNPHLPKVESLSTHKLH